VGTLEKQRSRPEADMMKRGWGQLLFRSIRKVHSVYRTGRLVERDVIVTVETHALSSDIVIMCILEDEGTKRESYNWDIRLSEWSTWEGLALPKDSSKEIGSLGSAETSHCSYHPSEKVPLDGNINVLSIAWRYIPFQEVFYTICPSQHS
jgi:hypothetical protein